MKHDQILYPLNITFPPFLLYNLHWMCCENKLDSWISPVIVLASAVFTVLTVLMVVHSPSRSLYTSAIMLPASSPRWCEFKLVATTKSCVSLFIETDDL